MRIKDRMSTVAVIGVATLLSTVLPAPPVSAAVGGDGPDRTPSCAPAGAPKVVDVTAHVTNSVDFGIDGHPWAIDDGSEHLQIWKVGLDHFCLQVDDSGTFTAWGSQSPNLTGDVSQGVTGTWTQTSVLTRTGTFSPGMPVTGDVGTWDRACADGACALPCLYAAYFSDTRAKQVVSISAAYDAGRHGTWTVQYDRNRVVESSGDITG
jgi:hypothetical protein